MDRPHLDRDDMATAAAGSAERDCAKPGRSAAPSRAWLKEEERSPLVGRLRYRLLRLLFASVLLALGWLAVSVLSPARTPSPAASSLPTPRAAPASKGGGLGAGDSPSGPKRARAAAQPAGCSLFDVTCWAQTALTTILLDGANPVQQFDQGVVGGFGQSLGGTNFVMQTPLCVSPLFGCDIGQPLDVTLRTFLAWAQLVADAALGFIVVMGGFNLLLGRQMGMRVHDLSEFLPRVILTFLAAWTAPMIVQAFIALNNALCQGIVSLLSTTAFTTLLTTLVQTGFSDGWLIFVFLVTLSLMALLLSGQMLFRLAFCAFLAGLSPIGLLCFALPQTLSWGRLWLRNFSVTIFVQFLQVAMLAVGGSMLTAIVALASPAFGSLQNANLILEIVLSIILLYLTIRLPGMLLGWALRATAEQVGAASMVAVGDAAQAVGEGAAQLALLVGA